MKNTQRKLAEKVGITAAMVSMILSGKAKPSWPLAKRLAAVTNTDPVDWIEGEIDQEIIKGEK